MSGKLTKFSRLSAEEKRYFLEAYLMLGLIRFAILTRPFKSLTRDLIQSPAAAEIPTVTLRQQKQAETIGRMVRIAAAHTPWESACLAQSLTVQKMLYRRQIPGVFYLGASRDREGSGEMKAHAWSQCGDVILTGEAGYETFTILSVFRWEPLQGE